MNQDLWSWNIKVKEDIHSPKESRSVELTCQKIFFGYVPFDLKFLLHFGGTFFFVFFFPIVQTFLRTSIHFIGLVSQRSLLKSSWSGDFSSIVAEAIWLLETFPIGKSCRKLGTVYDHAKQSITVLYITWTWTMGFCNIANVCRR